MERWMDGVIGWIAMNLDEANGSIIPIVYQDSEHYSNKFFIILSFYKIFNV